MLKEKLKQALLEVKSYSLQEKLFIIFAMICGFCITSEYSVTKPVSYSVFISFFSASYFPCAWLVSVPLNLFIVSLYNRYLPRFGCLRATCFIAFTIILINCLSSQLLQYSPIASFLHFVFKDIYVMLLFQCLWSVIHSTIAYKRAKYLYGILYSLGGLGAALGSTIPRFFAVKAGSESLLLFSAFILTMFTISYRYLLKAREAISSEGKQLPDITLKKSDTTGGFTLIKNSKYLTLILLIVVFMQVSCSLIDLQFNCYLEKAIPSKDLRTEYYGKLYGLIHSLNIGFQLFGSYLLLKIIGVKKSHLLMPLFFCMNMITFLFFPTFRLASFCYATLKSSDYSVFSILKEMLYLPLSVEEKFKAKSIIDVFAYRSSKAVASLLVLGLQALSLPNIGYYISYVQVGIFLVWATSVFFLFKEKALKLSQSSL